MPRQPRRQSRSNVYHCMLRGINKQDIFFDPKDYLEFQSIIRKTKKTFFYQLYSYVLMPNHIHLEIKDENQKLSQIIHSMDYRDEVIQKIKKIQGVTQLQIARILGINIRIVQRAYLKENKEK